jgi:hypothetical protein
MITETVGPTVFISCRPCTMPLPAVSANIRAASIYRIMRVVLESSVTWGLVLRQEQRFS